MGCAHAEIKFGSRLIWMVLRLSPLSPCGRGPGRGGSQNNQRYSFAGSIKIHLQNTSTVAALQPFVPRNPHQMAFCVNLGYYFTNWFNSNIGNSTASTIASTTTPMNNIIAGSIIAASAAMRVSISRCC